MYLCPNKYARELLHTLLRPEAALSIAINIDWCLSGTHCQSIALTLT